MLNLNECKLCSSRDENLNHDNCKYEYFDILRNLFKTEINDMQLKLKEKINECKTLQEQNNNLIKENNVLKLNVKKLEDDRLNDVLAPDTPPTQSLNRGMIEDNSNDESHKENHLQNFQDFSSPEDKKTKFLEIPRRKKIQLRIKSPNSAEKTLQETKWISRKPTKTSNIGFSFIQPMHQSINPSDSQTKMKPDLSKMSLNKSKKLKQTRINFNKSLDKLKRLESSDETYCDDVIMPTPHNTTFTRSFRSNSSTSPPEKCVDSTKSPNKETNKKPKLSVEKDSPPKNSNDSVEFLPVEDEIIFVSDTTNANNFELEESTDSCDLLNNYSLEFGKDDVKAETDLKPEKLNVLANKIPPNKYNELQITSPIRKKSEKAKRPGFDCPDCEKYYQLIGISMSDSQIQNRLNECSKHRKNQRLHHTPEGFWNPVFTPTQD